MLEKTGSQSGTLRRPFDQAGNVGNDKTVVVIDTHHPQIRVHGREGIISHPGTRCGNGPDEGAFAGIGQAPQTDIGKHAQFQAQLAFLSRLTGR